MNENEKLAKLLLNLEEELKTYELIDEDSKVHFNMITTEVCFDICKKYMIKMLSNG